MTQVGESGPISGECLLVLEAGLRTTSLGFQQVLYQRRLFLVFISDDAKLLYSRLVSGARRFKQQSGLLPLPVLHSYLDGNLGLRLVRPVAGLFHSFGLLSHSIVAPAPIEGLPRQIKTCDRYVLRKYLDIGRPEVLNSKAEVGYVFRLRQPAIIFSLLNS